MGHIKHQPIAATATGESTVISSVSGQSIAVVSLALFNGYGATMVQFQDEGVASSANVTGAMSLAANGSLVLAGTKDSPLWIHGPSESCNMSNTVATTLGGVISYITI